MCQLSDAGLRRLGECLGQWLTDLSLYSCYRAGDIGIMHIAKPGLLRVNYCGCYKVGARPTTSTSLIRDRSHVTPCPLELACVVTPPPLLLVKP